MKNKPVIAVVDDFFDEMLFSRLLKSFKSFKWDDNYSQKGVRKSIVFKKNNYIINEKINPCIGQIKEFIFCKKNILFYFSKLNLNCAEISKDKIDSVIKRIDINQTEMGLSSSLIEKIISKYIRNNLYKIKNFKTISRYIRRLLFGDKYKITFSLNYTNGSYNEAPHLDQRNKVLVGLIYLDDAVSDNFSNLTFWQNNSPNLKCDNSFYIKDGNLTKFKDIQQKKNRLVLFKNDDNAIHSAKGNTSGKRRFIYFSIVSARQINLY